MTIRILTGDCRAMLSTLDAESVQCVVTSPPYFGLRDYQTGTWEGGDPACGHTAGPRASSKSKLNGGRGQLDYERDCQMPVVGNACRCGAVRIDKQIGLEPTPAAYVAELVAVFREVRRVLRKDGVAFLNLGDSFNAAGREGHGTRIGYKQGTNRASANGVDSARPSVGTLKPKDLIGVPWRVAFALQDDGWYLRNDMIWHKPAPMPESVRDRCTRAHEYVFHLTKSERYFWDAAAIAEAVTDTDRAKYPRTGHAKDVYGDGITNLRNPKTDAASRAREIEIGTRNARTVWTIGPEPFRDAHYAVMPSELASRCIKAGSRPGDTVLDPFAGAGTTLLAADRLGRDAIGIELNPVNVEMARDRCINDAPMLAEVAA